MSGNEPLSKSSTSDKEVVTRREFEAAVDYSRRKRGIMECLHEAEESLPAREIANDPKVDTHQNNVYEPLHELDDEGFIQSRQNGDGTTLWEADVELVDDVHVETEPRWRTVDEAVDDLSEMVYLNYVLIASGILWLAATAIIRTPVGRDIAMLGSSLGLFGLAVLAFTIHQTVPGGVIEWIRE